MTHIAGVLKTASDVIKSSHNLVTAAEYACKDTTDLHVTQHLDFIANYMRREHGINTTPRELTDCSIVPEHITPEIQYGLTRFVLSRYTTHYQEHNVLGDYLDHLNPKHLNKQDTVSVTRVVLDTSRDCQPLQDCLDLIREQHSDWTYTRCREHLLDIIEKVSGARYTPRTLTRWLCSVDGTESIPYKLRPDIVRVLAKLRDGTPLRTTSWMKWLSSLHNKRNQ